MTHTKYKLAHLDQKRIAAAARKALMAADAHYFAWPARRQENFRATMSEETRTRIRHVLLESLLKIKCNTDNIDDVWHDLPPSKMTMINWASLLTSGIGEDYIYLNENMAEGKSLLDFATLYDYDYDDYLFQEQAYRQECPEYKSADYYACKHSIWARLLIRDQFYYATFLSLATYLGDEIDSAGNDYIDQLIPHEYVAGKDNGKPHGAGFLWDMQVDAAGQERQLDELRSHWHAYLQQRWLDLSNTFNDGRLTVYVENQDWDSDPQKSFIFANAATLKQIRWKHFIADCEPLLASFAAVAERRESEINRAKSWLIEKHQDVVKNFDPTVVRLRKKRKVILSAKAMEDMAKIDSGDEPFE